MQSAKETAKPHSDIRVVAECWTCAPGYGFQRPKDHPPMPLYSQALADGHRAAGHDVRPVEPQKGE